MRSLASNNYSGIHPLILDAIKKANMHHCIAYVGDPYTESAIKMFRNVLGKGIEVFFAFTRTGANTLGLKASADSFQTVLLSEEVHLNMDGARKCNTAATLNCTLKDVTINAGVDIFSFGGIKNGMMIGEAVVFFMKNWPETLNIS